MALTDKTSRLSNFTRALSSDRVIVLDGAMGTELQRRGVQTSLPLWSGAAVISHGELVEQIHLEYLKAGAEIITTNTFRTGTRPVRKAGIDHSAQELTVLACKQAHAAREAYGDSTRLVAGCVATLEDCYEPSLTPPDSELREEHSDMIKNLIEGGVDFVFAETMNTVREARIVLEAAHRQGVPAAISFVCNSAGDLISGESLLSAIAMAEEFNPLFIGTNCAPPDRLEKSVGALARGSKLPVCVYANGMGHPGEPLGWVFGELGTEAQRYVAHTRRWIEEGARIVGGCCGTTPEYIAQIAAMCGELQGRVAIR